MIKAVIFDIGETLIKYNKPLNWQNLYRPALDKMTEDCGLDFSEKDFEHAISTLSKYNTRINPREYEVSSDTIFLEILGKVTSSANAIEMAKKAFYSFFRNDVSVFPEVENVLNELTSKRITIGTLSDVAYGMDNQYALEDIATIMRYIQFPFTSNDIGYRKPSDKGIKIIAETIGIEPSEIMFVGDEKKDILCANKAGAVSVLINRTQENKNYDQDYEIQSLREIINIIESIEVD